MAQLTENNQTPHDTQRKPLATGLSLHLDEIKTADASTVNVLQKRKVKAEQLIIFTTQLSVMLESGVVLSDALEAIASQLEPGPLKMIITDVTNRITSGESFSTALATYPRVFNTMFISMVKASEASGKMPQMLNVLNGYLTFESETYNRVKGALTYPLIMMAVATVATAILMFFVLPRFAKIYEARGAALPFITRMLIKFSQALTDPESLTIVVTVLIAGGYGLHYWSGTLSGRRTIDGLKLRTPIIGKMFIDSVVTRSMRIISTMINTGVSLLDSIEVVKGVCENYYFHELWAETDRKIRAGYQFSESITLAPYSELIEPGIIQMLRAGEKSGKIGLVSDKIAIYYEKRLQDSIKNATALIEPLMIAVLGVVIGTVAIALLLPVFKISTVISQ